MRDCFCKENMIYDYNTNSVVSESWMFYNFEKLKEEEPYLVDEYETWNEVSDSLSIKEIDLENGVFCDYEDSFDSMSSFNSWRNF